MNALLWPQRARRGLCSVNRSLAPCAGVDLDIRQIDGEIYIIYQFLMYHHIFRLQLNARYFASSTSSLSSISANSRLPVERSISSIGTYLVRRMTDSSDQLKSSGPSGPGEARWESG